MLHPRHAHRWRLPAPHRTAGAAVRALAWLGPEEIEGNVAVIDRKLSEEGIDELKATFFREKDAAGSWIGHEAAISGDLQLVPEGSFREALADGHERMVNGGLLLGDEKIFGELMHRCQDIQERANRRGL